MMNGEILIYSLDFTGFSLDFDVKLQSSVWATRTYGSHHGSEFAFAVADTWLRIGDSRHLLISELHTGNLIQEMTELAARLRIPISVANIERLIPRGGWCAWMSGYWHRVEQDCMAADDEAIYEQLIPLSAMDCRLGHIGIYSYRGVPTIEAATRHKQDEKLIYACSEFDPALMSTKVEQLQQAIVETIIRHSESSRVQRE